MITHILPSRCSHKGYPESVRKVMPAEAEWYAKALYYDLLTTDALVLMIVYVLGNGVTFPYTLMLMKTSAVSRGTR